MERPPTAAEAWNNYFLQNFLGDLIDTFPECVELLTLKDAAEAMIEEDERSVLTKFLTEMEPHVDALSEKDETKFFDADIDILKQMNIQQYWTPYLEPETKESIWNYLQQLYVMGNTVANLDEKTLATLESYAQQLTDQWAESGVDESQIDLNAISMGAVERVLETNPELFQNADVNTMQSITQSLTQNVLPQNPTPVAQGGQQNDVLLFQINNMMQTLGKLNITPSNVNSVFPTQGQQQQQQQPIQAPFYGHPQNPFLTQASYFGNAPQPQGHSYQAQAPFMNPANNIYLATPITPQMWAPNYTQQTNAWPQAQQQFFQQQQQQRK